MSHWERVTNIKIKSMDTLKRALERAGFTVEADATVRGYSGAKLKSQLVAKKESFGSYDIGFDLKNGEVVVVADWWGIGCSGTKQQQVMDDLLQHYVATEAVVSMESQGWSFAEELDGDDIVLTGTRW